MDSKAEFVCSTCRISALETIVAGIKKELIKVKEALSATRENTTQDKESSATDAYCTSMHKSYASVTANEIPSNLPKLHSNTSIRSSSTKPSKQELSSSVSKYNIVLYGIEECPKGTARMIRFKNDLDRASSILSGLDSTIQAQSVSDVVRMGRYNPERKRPRPIL